MKWREWINKWDMASLKIKAPFLEMELQPSKSDMTAAWELYIELLTRITTQVLAEEDGVEQTALESVYSLFPTTRLIIKENGRECIEFTKLAIVVLNQIIRPFTAKWHKISVQKGFEKSKICKKFRNELDDLQMTLRIYSQMLAEMAGVEDLTELEG